LFNQSWLLVSNSKQHKHGGGTTRPLSSVGGVEELHGDPTVEPRPKVWTRGQKWKYSSAKDGAPKKLRCGIIQK